MYMRSLVVFGTFLIGLTANAMNFQYQSYQIPIDVKCDVHKGYISDVGMIKQSRIPVFGDVIEGSVALILIIPVKLSEGTCKRDFESLYITMNDFLDTKEKFSKEGVHHTFIETYSKYIQFKEYVTSKEIPEFESFIRNASCQVTGYYTEKEVDSYIEYLQDRLRILKEAFKK